MAKLDDVLGEVFAERIRQEALKDGGKFLYTAADPQLSRPEKLAMLTEELGEVAKHVMDLVILQTKGIRPGEKAADEQIAALREELLQVAAVAVAWVEGET